MTDRHTRRAGRVLPIVRDVLLVALVTWVGMSMMTSSVLKWQQQPRNARITVGDLVVLLVYLAWVAGCVVVMLMARRRRRSGWGWFFIAHTLSPLVAWLILLAIGRPKSDGPTDLPPSPPGRWRRRWALLSAPVRIGLLVGICLVILPIGWWWLRPATESLTQQLWRECHDTLLYTHPEWQEGYLERMTKHCMDERLLKQGAR